MQVNGRTNDFFLVCTLHFTISFIIRLNYAIKRKKSTESDEAFFIIYCLYSLLYASSSSAQASSQLKLSCKTDHGIPEQILFSGCISS